MISEDLSGPYTTVFWEGPMIAPFFFFSYRCALILRNPDVHTSKFRKFIDYL